MLARVILKARRARPFFARHPWVYLPSIDRVEGDPEPGAEVTVCTHDGTFIARGLFNPHSLIRVRLYRWDDAPLDREFWASRIASAVELRRSVLDRVGPGCGCRLIASESDGMSGLTVDQYDAWLVVQITSLALDLRRDELLDLLQEQTGARGMLPRLERGIAAQEGLPGLLPEGALRGELPTEPVVIEEHGLTYEVDLRVGQKTGFYLDQRDNRRAVAAYAAGRRMLDLYCYTGGFSLTALRHGVASQSLGIDSSAPAIDQARRNAVRNGLGHARFEQADAPEALAKLRASGERFGLVVCDPPKFARTERDLDRALQAYARLNRAVVEVLEPGGILATCSCSGHVSREHLQQVLASVAESSGRPIQLLEQRGAASDHPVSASCLETEYLKCLIARVG
jgi:23S rRNA (cytosine1962-C5)-methyltransferase